MNGDRVGFKLLVLACGSVLSCTTVFCQIPSAANIQIMQNQQNARDQQSGNSSDKNFVKKALQGSLFEIQASQLALQKSSNDDVKKFAQRMVDDHTKLADEMKPLAAQIGVSVPTEPAKKDKAEIAKLQSLSGDEFDKTYVRLMLKDHEADSAAFKQEATAGKSPLVKTEAANAEPVIDGHLQIIQGIAKSMNVSDSGM